MRRLTSYEAGWDIDNLALLLEYFSEVETPSSWKDAHAHALFVFIECSNIQTLITKYLAIDNASCDINIFLRSWLYGIPTYFGHLVTKYTVHCTSSYSKQLLLIIISDLRYCGMYDEWWLLLPQLIVNNWISTLETKWNHKTRWTSSTNELLYASLERKTKEATWKCCTYGRELACLKQNKTIRYDEEGSTKESLICNLRNDNQWSMDRERKGKYNLTTKARQAVVGGNRQGLAVLWMVGGYKQLDEGAGRQIWKCFDPLNCVASAAFRKHGTWCNYGTWVQTWTWYFRGKCMSQQSLDLDHIRDRLV